MTLLRSAIVGLLVTGILCLPVPRQDRQVLREYPRLSLSMVNTTDLRDLSPEDKEAVVQVRILYNIPLKITTIIIVIQSVALVSSVDCLRVLSSSVY
jgi:hypothetical protein